MTNQIKGVICEVCHHKWARLVETFQCSEDCSGLPLIIYTLNRHYICTFWIDSVFPRETYNKSVWSRFRISSFGMSCSLMIDVMRLWNASFSSSKNCSLGLIAPVVSLLLDHSTDFIKPLAQPSVSTMWLPKSFNFDVQFILINPIHINDHLSRIHSCNHMYSSQHVFHFYKKLISWGVGPT